MGSGKAHGIDRTDAEQLIAYLCWRAGVPRPKVSWSGRHVRGSYTGPVPYKAPRGTVHVGPRIRDGLAGVIHEVAHHVVAMRGPKLTRRERETARRGLARLGRGAGQFVHHGPTFVATLTELAAQWYGDPALYPWHTEYRSVRAAGAGPRKEER
jgi:hypothetical protein